MRTSPFTFVAQLAEIPVSWLIIKTSVPPIGVVASITIPPVLFTNLHRTTKHSIAGEAHGATLDARILTVAFTVVAVDRATAITIGILAAVYATLFPRLGK